MARLSINELTTFRWTLEEDVRHYRAAGIPAIGVWRRKLVDCGEERAIELLAQSGLAVSNLSWAGGFTGSDGTSYRDAIDDALDAVRVAGAIHSPILVVYCGGRAGHTTNHARRIFQKALTELIPAAAAVGVVLAIEPVHPHYAAEWSLLTQPDEVLELLTALGSPTVKLALDTYHFGLQEGVLERLPELAPHVAVVHLGDGKSAPEHEQQRCRLGDGVIPLARIVDALRSGGYDGDYDVELMGPDIERSNYQDLLTHCRAAFAKLTG
ncbi:MAG: sugar phosphate isomerase/epimerase [Pirellulales bacterium]